MIVKRQVLPLPGTRLAASHRAFHNGWISVETLKAEARKRLDDLRATNYATVGAGNTPLGTIPDSLTRQVA